MGLPLNPPKSQTFGREKSSNQVVVALFSSNVLPFGPEMTRQSADCSGVVPHGCPAFSAGQDPRPGVPESLRTDFRLGELDISFTLFPLLV